MPTGSRPNLEPKKMRRVAAPSEEQIDPADVSTIAAVWQSYKHQAAEMGKLEKEHNTQLSALVEELGEPDDKGHLWLTGISFPGWDRGNKVSFNALQRQKRTGVFINQEEAVRVLERKGRLADASVSYLRVKDPEKALEVLDKAGLLDGDVFETYTEVSEDKVRDLYYDAVIDEDEYNDIFQTRVTWALLPGRV